MDTGGGLTSLDSGYPLIFNGSWGSKSIETGAGGRFSVVLPVGSYVVTDGYAAFSCARPPTVKPATITVRSGSQVIDLTTTGCIVF